MARVKQTARKSTGGKSPFWDQKGSATPAKKSVPRPAGKTITPPKRTLEMVPKRFRAKPKRHRPGNSFY
jgi:hypothetical protein